MAPILEVEVEVPPTIQDFFLNQAITVGFKAEETDGPEPFLVVEKGEVRPVFVPAHPLEKEEASCDESDAVDVKQEEKPVEKPVIEKKEEEVPQPKPEAQWTPCTGCGNLKCQCADVEAQPNVDQATMDKFKATFNQRLKAHVRRVMEDRRRLRVFFTVLLATTMLITCILLVDALADLFDEDDINFMPSTYNQVPTGQKTDNGVWTTYTKIVNGKVEKKESFFVLSNALGNIGLVAVVLGCMAVLVSSVQKRRVQAEKENRERLMNSEIDLCVI